MNNRSNLQIYRRYAPLYDRLMRAWTATARRKAINILQLRPGERLFIPGVGTGLDLPLIPAGVCIVAGDLSPAMLHRARNKQQEPVGFIVMDAQALPLPDGSCDAVLLNLILSVVPNGPAAMLEAWRVLKPGGRVAVFDKFLPEGRRLSGFRVLMGWLIRHIGTDPNRRLGEILQRIQDASELIDQPVLLNGQYRVVLLHKTANGSKKNAYPTN